MANVFKAAEYILTTIGGEISSMKLQKLCYYSQAWTLAWDDRELFPEEFLRWDNGPVCRELFDSHKGSFFVTSDLINNACNACNMGLFSEKSSNNELSDNEKFNIGQVLEDYGNLNGAQLSDLTHKEAPWLNTLKDEVIEKEVMKKYYLSLIASHGQKQ